MPDAWKLARGFQPDDDLSSYVWPSGYVGVEEYLNEIDLNGIEIVDVTGVEVTPETATINLPDNETFPLSAEVFPINATNQSGVWSSSDESIATVNLSGVVTPVGEGEATITFTTNDGNFTDSALITVTNVVIPLESVLINPDTITLDLGETTQLNTEFTPINTTDTTGTWSTSDAAIAVVDTEGNVTGVNEGDATITFTANDGGFTATAVVTVLDVFFGTYELFNADTDELIQNI